MSEKKYDDTNRGVLFPNDQEGNENRPNFKGKVNVEGKDYELAAWARTSKAGNDYMHLKVQEVRVEEEVPF